MTISIICCRWQTCGRSVNCLYRFNSHRLSKEVYNAFRKKTNSDLGLGGSRPKLDTNEQWSPAKWAEVFEDSLQELAKEFEAAAKENRVLVWDKDDEHAMHFVAACANLRAHIFHIGSQSLFDVKGHNKTFILSCNSHPV